MTNANAFENDVTQTIDAAGVTIDNNTQEVVQSGMKASVSAQEATILMEVLGSLGKQMGTDYRVQTDAKDPTKMEVTVFNTDPQEMNLIQRKTNIRSWSKKMIQVSGAVTNFVTDVADYTLNAAVAPAAVATANAALTTTRVVASAATKMGAGVLASTIRNARAMGTEIYHSPEIRDCGRELSGMWSDISGKIFGGTNLNGKWTAC